MLQKKELFAQVVVYGRVFGTQGFLDVPLPTQSGLPFSLSTRNYLYRSPDNTDAFKSFAKAAYMERTMVHTHHTYGWRIILTKFQFHSDIMMNHYQFRAIMDIDRKSKANNNPALLYESHIDLYRSGIPDSNIQYLIPQLKNDLKKRVDAGAWNHLPKLNLSGVNHLSKPEGESICVIASNQNKPLHYLRRMLSTFRIHLNLSKTKMPVYIVVFIKPRIIDNVIHITSDNLKEIIPDIVEQVHQIVTGDVISNYCEGFKYRLNLGQDLETGFYPDTYKYPQTFAEFNQPILDRSVDFLKSKSEFGFVSLVGSKRASSSWQTFDGGMFRAITESDQDGTLIFQEGNASKVGVEFCLLNHISSCTFGNTIPGLFSRQHII